MPGGPAVPGDRHRGLGRYGAGPTLIRSIEALERAGRLRCAGRGELPDRDDGDWVRPNNDPGQGARAMGEGLNGRAG